MSALATGIKHRAARPATPDFTADRAAAQSYGGLRIENHRAFEVLERDGVNLRTIVIVSTSTRTTVAAVRQALAMDLPSGWGLVITLEVVDAGLLAVLSDWAAKAAAPALAITTRASELHQLRDITFAAARAGICIGAFSHLEHELAILHALREARLCLAD